MGPLPFDFSAWQLRWHHGLNIDIAVLSVDVVDQVLRKAHFSGLVGAGTGHHKLRLDVGVTMLIDRFLGKRLIADIALELATGNYVDGLKLALEVDIVFSFRHLAV